MGCGNCEKTIEGLRQRVVDLEAVVDELKAEYLALAQDYDLLAEAVDGKENEDE